MANLEGSGGIRIVMMSAANSTASAAVANSSSSGSSSSPSSSAVLRGRRHRKDDGDDDGGDGGIDRDGVSSSLSANKRPKTTASRTDDDDDIVVGDDDLSMMLAKLLGLSSSSSSSSKQQDGEEEDDQQPPFHSFVGTFTKDDVKELVEEAMKEEDDDDDASSSKKKEEQATIYDAGLLSLQQVLLPLVAIQHERGLRSFQGLLKRDAQDWREEEQQQPTNNNNSNDDDGFVAMDELYQCAIQIVQHCRATALEAIGAAVEAARASEQRRVQQYKQQLVEEHQQHVAKSRAQKQLQMEIHKIGRPKRLREARKRHPPNVELYREQAMLLSQLAQLDNELEKWEVVERQVEAEAAQVAAVTAELRIDDTNEDVDVDRNNNNTNNHSPRAFVDELLDEVERAQVSVDRIQSATSIVDDMVTKAEQTRAQLYKYYTESVRYQQYQVPIRRPRALLKELSQQSSNSVVTAPTASQQEEHADESPTTALAQPAPLAATTNRTASSAGLPPSNY